NFGAFISLLKCVVGTGILALPLAFYYAGIIFGTILLIVVAFILIHGMQLMIMCMIESSRRQQMGYCTFPLSMKFSLSQGPRFFQCIANAGAAICYIVLISSHYGVCVVYLVFVSENLKQMFDFHVTELNVRIYVAIVGLLMMAPFMIRSLKWLVPFNLLASVLIYLGFTCIIYYLFQDLPPISQRAVVFGEVAYLPLFFGIALFSITSVGVMLAIEAKMEHPEQYIGWFGILDLSIVVVIISYTFFGVMGYWKYGDAITGSITLNLPTKETVAQISKTFIMIAIFFTYPLCGYVVIDIIMNQFWNRNGELKHAVFKEYIVRVVFVLISTINAAAFPNLGPLLSLVGAFTISLLNVIFPAIMEICLLYPPEYNYGKLKWKLIKDILLFLFGTFVLVLGTTSSINEMIRNWGGEKTTAEPTTVEDTTELGTTLAAAAPAPVPPAFLRFF
ncbi:hypothetical protein KR074_006493, partial [Drosophila pseudoananassae]